MTPIVRGTTLITDALLRRLSLSVNVTTSEVSLVGHLGHSGESAIAWDGEGKGEGPHPTVGPHSMNK